MSTPRKSLFLYYYHYIRTYLPFPPVSNSLKLDSKRNSACAQRHSLLHHSSINAEITGLMAMERKEFGTCTEAILSSSLFCGDQVNVLIYWLCSQWAWNCCFNTVPYYSPLQAAFTTEVSSPEIWGVPFFLGTSEGFRAKQNGLNHPQNPALAHGSTSGSHPLKKRFQSWRWRSRAKHYPLCNAALTSEQRCCSPRLWCPPPYLTITYMTEQLPTIPTMQTME